jgi:hypothetical protein
MWSGSFVLEREREREMERERERFQKIEFPL